MILIEQYKKQKQDKSLQLFHFITAAISFIETNINQARYDEKNDYEWTKKNASFNVDKYTHDYKKISIFNDPINIGNNYYSGIEIGPTYYFELERQRLLIDLFILKNVLYFWYKTIFPFENVVSYKHNLAVNINTHIAFILEMNRMKKDAISLFSDVSRTYYVIIEDLLEIIFSTTPKEFCISMIGKSDENVNKKYNNTVLQMRKNAKLINEKLREKYVNIFKLSRAIGEDIFLLGHDFKNSLDNDITARLSNNYKKLINCKLEINENRANFKIKFNIIDLNKIQNKIHLLNVFYIKFKIKYI